MSQLLLCTDTWIYHQYQQNQSSKVDVNPLAHDQKKFANFDAKLMRHLLPHREFTQVATTEDFKTKRYSVLIQNLSQNHRGLLSCVYHKLQGKVSFYFQLLNLEGKLLKLQTSQMLVQIIKILHLAQKRTQFPLKLMVNYESLQIFFQIIYFSHSKSNLVDDTERTNKYNNVLLQIYKNYIQRNSNIIQKALELLVAKQDKQQQQQQKKLVQSLYRYANMMTMKANFYVGEIISEQTKVKLLQQRQESGRIMQLRKQYIQPEVIKNLQLYGNIKIRKEEKNKNEFYISGLQEKAIKKEIAFQLPQADKDSTKKYLNFINPIHVHQPEKLITYPLNSGGFSQLFSSEVNFWLVQSTQQNKPPDFNPKNIQRKILAVKKQSKPSGKNLHEVRILQELKVAFLPILPRYYLPVNIASNPIEKNPLLMMDILINGNLADFMKNRKKISSLNSKLVLMFSITMGLRFLQKFKIVHLDFKPSNIMMAPDFLIKIIDFGEAFHPEVVKKQGGSYKPGITLPYSPPQMFGGKTVRFTNKSDAFSLGVIFFQLIFGKRPFQNRQQLFLAPEESHKYGDGLVLRVLNWMISRCLSVNPEQRPEFDWISMILKICMCLDV